MRANHYLQIAIVAVVALAVVVGYAITTRDSGFEVVIDRERGVTLSFEERRIELGELLLRVLAEDGDTSTQRQLAEAVLERQGYYHLGNIRLADALRTLAADDPSGLAAELRRLLYDLQGPFATPHTLAGAPDDRLLQAFDALDIDFGKADEVTPEAVSPLLASLWQQSLNRDGVLRPRAIRATLRPAGGIERHRALACTNSVLDGKEVTVSGGHVLMRFRVDANQFCDRPAPRPRELLVGVAERLYVPREDFAELVGGEQRTSKDVRLVVSPRALGVLSPTP
jgi:hypothetical protein